MSRILYGDMFYPDHKPAALPGGHTEHYHGQEQNILLQPVIANLPRIRPRVPGHIFLYQQYYRLEWNHGQGSLTVIDDGGQCGLRNAGLAGD